MNSLEIYALYQEWRRSDRVLRFGQFFIVQVFKEGDEPDPDVFYQRNHGLALRAILGSPRYNDDLRRSEE